MRREERVTVQGPVKKQQPDGMSHRGGGGYRHSQNSASARFEGTPSWATEVQGSVVRGAGCCRSVQAAARVVGSCVRCQCLASSVSELRRSIADRVRFHGLRQHLQCRQLRVGMSGGVQWRPLGALHRNRILVLQWGVHRGYADSGAAVGRGRGSDVLERPYTAGGGGGGVTPPLPPPPPLPMFEADSQNFASVPRGLKLKICLPAFGGDHRGTQGGGVSQPTPPPPLQTPPPPPPRSNQRRFPSAKRPPGFCHGR